MNLLPSAAKHNSKLKLSGGQALAKKKKKPNNQTKQTEQNKKPKPQQPITNEHNFTFQKITAAPFSHPGFFH